METVTPDVLVTTGLGARKLDVIVFVKTSTVTMGQPKVVDVVPDETASTDELPGIATAIEQHSDHPITPAILERAEGISSPDIAHFQCMDGRSASANASGTSVLVGNRGLMDENDVDSGKLGCRAEALEGKGRTVTYVDRDGKHVGNCRRRAATEFRSHRPEGIRSPGRLIGATATLRVRTAQ